MRNKAADIAWKFANKLRDKYASQRVVTAMITYLYISWEAKGREGENNDPSILINNALDEFGENFDEQQFQVFQKSIDLLKNEVEGLFYDDFFNYLIKADEKDLKELLAFLIRRTGEIDKELNDFTNTEISSLFVESIEHDSYKKVLDPCIGSGGLIVELANRGKIDPQKATVYGVEINPLVSLIAYINLRVNGFSNFTITTSNVLAQDLDENDYDLIVSDLPLGVRLRDRSFGGEDVPAHWRFYHLLFKTTLQRLNKTGSAYFTSSAHVIRDLNKYSKNEQAELPIYDSVKNYSQTLSQIIDVSDVANRPSSTLPTFMLSFQGSIVQDIEFNKLNVSGEIESSILISKTDWYNFNQIKDPSFFLSETFEKIATEGREEFRSLGKFFNSSVAPSAAHKKVEEDPSSALYFADPKNVSAWREVGPGDLEALEENFTFGEVHEDGYGGQYVRHSKLVEPGSWILLTTGARPPIEVVGIAYLNINSNIAIFQNFAAIKPNTKLSELDKEWLRRMLLSSFVQDQIKAIYPNQLSPALEEYKLLERVLIPKRSDKEKEEFINNWKERRIEELEEKQKTIREKYEDILKKEKEDKLSEEFDLIHDLQHTLKNDISAIKGAVTSIEKYLMNKEKTGEKVDMNEPVSKLRPGGDPKLIDSVRERFDMLKNTTESMSNFLKKYKDLLRFDPKRHNQKWIRLKDFFEKHGKGYEEFNFEVREIFDEKGKNKPYELKADPEVLRLVFKNIISNAIDHAFTKKGAQYSLVVEIKQSTEEIQLSEEKSYPEFSLNIIIKNDGEPILDEISESEFFSRGIGNSRTGSGLGGFHINRGVESMGGKVKLLEPEEDDPYQMQLLIQFFDDDVRFRTQDVDLETKVSGSEALGKS